MYRVNYYDDNLFDEDRLAEFESQVAMLCKDCGVERATPVLSAKTDGVDVDQLDTHNTLTLCSDFVTNVIQISVEDMFCEEIEAPVLSSMEILAMVYNKVSPGEMWLRGLMRKDLSNVFNDGKETLDVSAIEDKQDAIESGMVILSNYGVDVDFITNDLMGGARKATDQLMEVLPRMEDGEIFLVYAMLKFRLEQAKEKFAKAIQPNATDIEPVIPMFGNFSLN
jgi:hypothetical protein